MAASGRRVDRHHVGPWECDRHHGCRYVSDPHKQGHSSPCSSNSTATVAFAAGAQPQLLGQSKCCPGKMRGGFAGCCTPASTRVAVRMQQLTQPQRIFFLRLAHACLYVKTCQAHHLTCPTTCKQLLGLVRAVDVAVQGYAVVCCRVPQVLCHQHINHTGHTQISYGVSHLAAAAGMSGAATVCLSLYKGPCVGAATVCLTI